MAQVTRESTDFAQYCVDKDQNACSKWSPYSPCLCVPHGLRIARCSEEALVVVDALRLFPGVDAITDVFLGIEMWYNMIVFIYYLQPTWKKLRGSVKCMYVNVVFFLNICLKGIPQQLENNLRSLYVPSQSSRFLK